MRRGFILIALAFFSFSAHASKKIVTSIYPVFSLVKNVSGDINDVQLLISQNLSPHDYKPKPSDIKRLKEAEIVFVVDESFESFINSKNLEQLNIVSLIKASDVRLLDVRHAGCGCDKGHSHKHAHEHVYDLHFWGNPHNAKMAVNAIALKLGEIDPDNGQIYIANAIKTVAKIEAMDKRIEEILSSVRQYPFIVFHDGYQYFEDYYGLKNVGSVTQGHNAIYGAKTLKKIINTVKETNAKCIFAEPQSSPNLIQKVSKVTGVKIGYLDIEGSGVDKPKDLPVEEIFFYMMEKNALNFKECLS